MELEHLGHCAGVSEKVGIGTGGHRRQAERTLVPVAPVDVLPTDLALPGIDRLDLRPAGDEHQSFRPFGVD